MFQRLGVHCIWFTWCVMAYKLYKAWLFSKHGLLLRAPEAWATAHETAWTRAAVTIWSYTTASEAPAPRRPELPLGH